MLISSIVLCVALALAILAGVLLPCSIAYASSEKEAVLATVSNLEGNAYPMASTVALYLEGDGFYIPESYYVTDVKKVTAIDITYYTVTYCGKEFSCKDSSLSSVSKVSFDDDVSPYPDVALTVVGENLVLNGKTVTNDYTIKFLGYHLTDDSQIFVMATHDGDTIYGFAAKDSFNAFVIPYHPIAQAERERILESKKPAEPKSGDILPNTSLALRIVLIIGIAVPAIIIVILLFKPSKNDRSAGNNRLRRSRRRDEFDYDSSRTYDRPYDDRNSDRRAQDGYGDRDSDRRAYDGYDDRNRGYDRGRDDRGYDRGYDRDGRDFDDYDRRDGRR